MLKLASARKTCRASFSSGEYPNQHQNADDGHAQRQLGLHADRLGQQRNGDNSCRDPHERTQPEHSTTSLRNNPNVRERFKGRVNNAR